MHDGVWGQTENCPEMKTAGKECENSLPELLQVEDRFSVTTSNMYSKRHVGHKHSPFPAF